MARREGSRHARDAFSQQRQDGRAQDQELQHPQHAGELAKRTRLEHYAFGNAGRRNWLVSNYGIAILSKYEMVDTRTYALPSGKEPRVMMCTKVLAPAGTTTVCNAHLGLSADEGLAQVKEMNRIIAGFGTDRVVLMGDFKRDARQVRGRVDRVARLARRRSTTSSSGRAFRAPAASTFRTFTGPTIGLS